MKLEKEMYTDTETAVLGGGCFWCTEAIFQRLKGVLLVTPGYSGTTIAHPEHAEVIQITFNPKVISYAKILDVFWHLHNPTTLNQQDYDVGPQYRSALFYLNDRQKQIAERSKRKLETSGTYEEKIVTDVVPFTGFFPAESYHHNYFNKHMPLSDGYCQVIIDPKIKKLLREYGDDVKEEYKKT